MHPQQGSASPLAALRCDDKLKTDTTLWKLHVELLAETVIHFVPVLGAHPLLVLPLVVRRSRDRGREPNLARRRLLVDDPVPLSCDFDVHNPIPARFHFQTRVVVFHRFQLILNFIQNSVRHRVELGFRELHGNDHLPHWNKVASSAPALQQNAKCLMPRGSVWSNRQRKSCRLHTPPTRCWLPITCRRQCCFKEMCTSHRPPRF
mmetsp:Transcript_41310/g.83053  ORF Transcript_41310/g.83053 Transcript_41310/m.83053 type:complete len:205 (+) Transcript_41310:68-682(+)